MLSASILLMHDHAAQAGLLRLGEDAAGVDLDARLGVDHHRRRVHAPQGADRLADEVGIARRVDHLERACRRGRSGPRVASMVYLCCFSSSSKSQMLVPSSTLAGRLMAPVLTRRRSTRVVLPADPCPQKAMLRMICDIDTWP